MSGDTRNYREAILAAGLREFSHQGYDGARLERVAAEAGCAKRMIYHYFTNKEGLYSAVLEQAYTDIRAAEQRLELAHLSAREALVRLAESSFDYHEANRDFIRLVMVENIQGGRLIAMLARREELREAALAPLRDILERGVKEGVFRRGVDVAGLHYLISALCAFRMDHAGTWKGVLDIDLLGERERVRHRRILIESVLAHVAV